MPTTETPLDALAAAACELRDALTARSHIPKGYPLQAENRQRAEHGLARAVERTRAALAALPDDPHQLQPPDVRRAIDELRGLAQPGAMVEGVDYRKMTALAGTAVNVLIRAGANVTGNQNTAAMGATAGAFHTLPDAFWWYFAHLRVERRPQTHDERRELIRDAIGHRIGRTSAPVTDDEVDEADRTWDEMTEVVQPIPDLAALDSWLHKHGGPRWFTLSSALFTPESSDRSPLQRAAVAWLSDNSIPGMIRSLVEAMRAAGLEPPIVETAPEPAGPRADGAMEATARRGKPAIAIAIRRSDDRVAAETPARNQYAIRNRVDHVNGVEPRDQSGAGEPLVE